LKTEIGEHVKPRSQYADEAVQLAIAGKWDEAAKLNRVIIESFGADEETQNRLGKALSELGKLKDAKAAYEAALKLNPMNSIAKKNAARINTLLHQKEGLKVGGTRVDLNLFVEEMGKTIITALEGASGDICSKVAAGDVAELRIEGDGIMAETARGLKLGQLEAKLARRLIKFMRGGNRYQGGVTSCDGNSVKLIVRETYQDPKFVGKPSFPMRRKREVEFRPYTKESLLSRGSGVEVFTEDEEEEALVETPAADDLEEGMHAVEDEVLVDLVGDHPGVMLARQGADQVQLGPAEHLAGGVVRGVQQDQPGLRGECRPQRRLVDREVRKAQHGCTPRGSGQGDRGGIRVVVRLEHHDLITRLAQAQDHGSDRFGCPGSDQDLVGGVDGEPVEPSLVLGNRGQQLGDTGSRRILVAPGADRVDGGL